MRHCHGPRTLRLFLAFLALLTLAGCGTLHGWGQKGASSPVQFGAGISVPLGSGGK